MNDIPPAMELVMLGDVPGVVTPEITLVLALPAAAIIIVLALRALDLLVVTSADIANTLSTLSMY